MIRNGIGSQGDGRSPALRYPPMNRLKHTSFRERYRVNMTVPRTHPFRHLNSKIDLFEDGRVLRGTGHRDRGI
eukprot:766006-Hanusia_phi.AAC.4